MDGKKIKDALTQDIRAKFICLILAVFVWIYISTELIEVKNRNYVQKVLREIEVVVLGKPLQLSNVIFDIRIIPGRINAVLRGPQDKINELSQKNVAAFVDIKELRLDKEFSLPVQMILPSDIELVGEPEPSACRVILSTRK